MAQWVVYENSRNSLTLLYRNKDNGCIHNCGDIRKDTPQSMVVALAVKAEAGRPGDIIRFPDGTVFFYLTQEPAQA